MIAVNSLSLMCFNLMFQALLMYQPPTPQNGQTHSNNGKVNGVPKLCDHKTSN